MKIFSILFGTTIKSITSRISVVIVLGFGGYLWYNYTDAIRDAKRYKYERDALVIENTEIGAYNSDLLLQYDSLMVVQKSDYSNYESQKQDYQVLIGQLNRKVKDKDKLIEEVSKGLKCKNIFGKIVDC